MTQTTKRHYYTPRTQLIAFDCQPLMLQGSAGGPNQEIIFGESRENNTNKQSYWEHNWH